jgi:chromosome segregation ATPase
MTDQDAVFGYLNNVAKRTQDNYKQVNNILKQLDPLNTELHQAEKELQDVETVNRQQQDVLRGLSNRLDQVRTQNLPSQQRAKAPEKSTAKDSTVSKEIDAINKKLDKQQHQHQHQQPAQQVQQQPADNSQAIANLQGQIASIQKMLDKMPGSLGDQTAEAAKLRVKQQNLIHQLRSAQATTAQKMTPGLAKELLHDPEDMQQNLPFNEDEIMESRLYAMKRAGYDIL